MIVSYPGPHLSVTIAATGQETARDGAVEVADELSRRLVAQGWAELKVADLTIDQLTAYVGDDIEKAKQALKVEKAKKSPRQGAIETLEAVIDPPATEPDNDKE